MRSAIFRNGSIVVYTLPDPEPAEGKVDVTPLVTGTVGLDGVSGAFAELANPDRHAKVVVDPWA